MFLHLDCLQVYQRGVVNPMINMEQLWKDYMAFEQNINPIIAEKMAIERSRDYMNARRVAKELEAVTRGLNRSAPSVPPTGHPEEIKQVIKHFALFIPFSQCLIKNIHNSAALISFYIVVLFHFCKIKKIKHAMQYFKTLLLYCGLVFINSGSVAEEHAFTC